MLPIDGTQLDTTIPGLSESGSNENERVIHTPQISRIGTPPSDLV